MSFSRTIQGLLSTSSIATQDNGSTVVTDTRTYNFIGPNVSVALDGLNKANVTIAAAASVPEYWESTSNGTIFATGSAEITGSLLVKGVISGSHTKLSNGNPAFIAGPNMTVAFNPDGAVEFSSSFTDTTFWHSDVVNTVKTTGSAEITGSLLVKGVISGSHTKLATGAPAFLGSGITVNFNPDGAVEFTGSAGGGTTDKLFSNDGLVYDNLELYLDAGNYNSFTGTGSVATDLSPNGYTMPLTGAMLTGSAGESHWRFSGTGSFSYVEAQVDATFNDIFVSGGTLITAFRPFAQFAGGDTFSTVLDNRGSSGGNSTRGWAITIGNEGTFLPDVSEINFSVNRSGPSAIQFLVQNVIKSDEWNLVAINYNAQVPGTCSYVINNSGPIQATNSFSGDNVAGNTENLRLGTSQTAASVRGLWGDIDMVMGFSRELSYEEIQQVFSQFNDRLHGQTWDRDVVQNQISTTKNVAITGALRVTGEISGSHTKLADGSPAFLGNNITVNFNSDGAVELTGSAGGGSSGTTHIEESVWPSELKFAIDVANRASYPGHGNVLTDLTGGITFDMNQITTGSAAKSHHNYDGSTAFATSSAGSGGVPASWAGIWEGGATVAYWARPISAGGSNNGAIIHTGTALGLNGWGILNNNDTGEYRPYFIKQNTAGSTSSGWVVTNGTGVPYGEWYFVVLRYNCDSAANDARFDINGIPQSITEVFAGVEGCYDDEGNTIRIGGFNGQSYQFDGDIDAIYIWDYELSDEEIAYQYHKQKSRFIPHSSSLVAGDGVTINYRVNGTTEISASGGGSGTSANTTIPGTLLQDCIFFVDAGNLNSVASGSFSGFTDLISNVQSTTNTGVTLTGSHANFASGQVIWNETIPADTANVFDSGGTFHAWVRAETAGGGNLGTILSHANSAVGWTIFAEPGAAGTVDISMYHGFSGTDFWQRASDVLVLDEWHLVSIVYDNSATTHDMYVYIDGQEVIVGSVQTPTGTANAASSGLTMGYWGAITARSWDGDIEIAYLSDIPHSPEDIRQFYEATKNRFYPPTQRLNFTDTHTASKVVEKGQRLAYDPSGGTFTINAPANPVFNDIFSVKNVTNDSTAITISGNGDNIEDPQSGSVGANFSASVPYFKGTWQYSGSTWFAV